MLDDDKCAYNYEPIIKITSGSTLGSQLPGDIVVNPEAIIAISQQNDKLNCMSYLMRFCFNIMTRNFF